MPSDDPIEEQFPALPGSPEGLPETALRCQEWEALAVEAVEGSLSEEQGAALERHLRRCPSCAEIREQSRRGAQWLHFLEERPEPPAGLAEAIVAATSGAATRDMDRSALRERAGRPASPFWSRNRLSPRRGSPAGAALGAPGLLMTTAMAFFSLALTAFLLAAPLHRRSVAQEAAAGGPFAGFHLSILTPSGLRRTAVRRYYSMQERSAKFYDNLLVVREAEAEVRDLSSAATAQPHDGGTEPEHLRPSPSSRNGGAEPLQRQPDRSEAAVRRDSRLHPGDGPDSRLVSHLSSLDQPVSFFSRQRSRA